MIIEKSVIKHLSDSKYGIKAYAEKPSKAPDEYVIVNLIDGSVEDHIFEADVEIKSTSTSKLKAAELDEKVREAMEEFCDATEVSGCKIGGFSNDTDLTNKQYRYSTIYIINY